MKIQFWTFCLFFISFFGNGGLTFAQNLIPNPGFEDWDGTSGSGAGSLDGLFNWYTANGTSDHHHTSISGNNLTGLQPCPLGQGNTDCGYPVAGEAVLGCWKGNGIDGTREWAGVQLTQPFEVGACYKVSFWIQNKEDNPNALYETNQWGVFFSETQLPTFSVNVIDYTSRLDQIVMTEEVVGDTVWHYFELDYYANEPYQYAYFGFQGNVSTSTFTSANPDALLGFYVWFDEVSIVKVIPELTVSDDATICPGESVQVTANSNFPVIWSHLGSDTTSSFLATPQTTTTYYVQTQDGTDCAILDSVVIEVNQGEFIEYPNDEIICLGSDPFVLYTNPLDGSWVGQGIADATTSLFDPNIAGAGTHQINYISNNDCSENFTVELQVQDTPILDIEPDVNIGCTPLEVNFTDFTPIIGISYNWDFGNGSVSNEIGSATTTYNELGSFDISLSVTYSDHCAASISNDDFIQVGEIPTANFSYAPIKITNLDPGVQFENSSSLNATDWFWDFGNGSSNTQLNPFYQFPQPGIYDVQLLVTSNEGCQDSITQTLTVTNEINFYIPNVFSPNKDGVNDHFEIFPIGLVESYQLTILDRWGETVFISDDLLNRWDGSFKGKPVQQGVYIYMLEYQFMDFINEELKKGVLGGNVTVLK